MDDTALARHLRLIFVVLLATIAIAALLGWFGQADGAALFLVVGLGSMVALPVGGLVLLAMFAILARDGWRLGSARADGSGWLVRGAAPLALVLAIASLVFIPPVFSGLHRQHLLSENLPLFDDAMRRDATRITLTNGEQIVASPENGGRYYFSLGGLADNHQGFVHDPTGQVAQARGWADGEAGRFTAPEEVRRLFGGDMLECEPVSGDWFYCTFT